MGTVREEHPDLVAEWDYSRNAPLTPDTAQAGWRRDVFWRCSSDPTHVWKAGIRARGSDTGGCPYCWVAPHSETAKAIARELTNYLTFDPDQHKIPLPDGEGAADVDIIVPHPFGRNKPLVVEYDSYYFHKCRDPACTHRGSCPHRNDRSKTLRLIRLGCVVIRIRELPLDELCRGKKHHRHDIYVAPRSKPAEIAAMVIERLR